MNLHRRLRSLERSASLHRPAACPDCGVRPGERPQYRPQPIEWDAAGDQIHHDPSGPEVCPGCARRLVVRLLPITLDEKW